MLDNIIRLAFITVLCLHVGAVPVYSQESIPSEQKMMLPEDQRQTPRKEREHRQEAPAPRQERKFSGDRNGSNGNRSFQEERRSDRRLEEGRSGAQRLEKNSLQQRTENTGTPQFRAPGDRPAVQSVRPAPLGDRPVVRSVRPTDSPTREQRDGARDRTEYTRQSPAPSVTQQAPRPAQDDGKREFRHDAPSHGDRTDGIRPRPGDDDRRREASPRREEYRRPDDRHREYRYSKPVVHRLPTRHAVILHGRDHYHYYEGRFYMPWGLGFMLVRPPLGLVVLNIPLGSRIVVSAGISYYVFGDVYYRRVPMGYEVVEPIRGPVSGWPDRVQVVTDLLNLRYGPDSNEEVIAQVQRYTVLRVLGSAPGWLYVEIEGEDVRGWVMERYVSANLGRG